MKLHDFAALTFDCYGTLIDWEQGIVHELKPWTEKNGRTVGDDEILSAFSNLEPKHQAESPDKLYPDVLAAVFIDLGKRWDIPASEDEAVAFGKSIGRWPAFDDTAPSLQYLKHFYKLVILSNVDRDSFAESNKQLGVTFDGIITAQDVGSYKPDPRNFEYAIKTVAELGVAKERLLHCGQSLFHDVAPGRAARLATMWVNRSKGKTSAAKEAVEPVTPDFEVANLAEFVNMHKAAIAID
ncbi:MAG: HAD-IA family hydrolase [Acidiferrobacterales bacterium]